MTLINCLVLLGDLKKFRWPEHINQEISTIPMELGPSIEQYALAERLGANAFF
jgi:hypothetical protein